MRTNALTREIREVLAAMKAGTPLPCRSWDRAMYRWIALGVLSLVLAACAPARVVTKPVIVETVRNVVVPVPPELVQPEPVAEGSLSECPTVAAQRKSALLACNAKLEAIDGLDGE